MPVGTCYDDEEIENTFMKFDFNCQSFRNIQGRFLRDVEKLGYSNNFSEGCFVSLPDSN